MPLSTSQSCDAALRKGWDAISFSFVKAKNALICYTLSWNFHQPIFSKLTTKFQNHLFSFVTILSLFESTILVQLGNHLSANSLNSISCCGILMIMFFDGFDTEIMFAAEEFPIEKLQN